MKTRVQRLLLNLSKLKMILDILNFCHDISLKNLFQFVVLDAICSWHSLASPSLLILQLQSVRKWGSFDVRGQLELTYNVFYAEVPTEWLKWKHYQSLKKWESFWWSTCLFCMLIRCGWIQFGKTCESRSREFNLTHAESRISFTWKYVKFTFSS